jgi:hypothetical protein
MRAEATPTPAAQSPLLQRAIQGLTLDDEPFDRLGAPMGLGGDAVIEALRQWLSRGVIVRVGPVFVGAGVRPITGAWAMALQAASASGLPLVRQPYEALGAMLGAPATRVQAQLADWLAHGQVLRIAAVPAVPGR